MEGTSKSLLNGPHYPFHRESQLKSGTVKDLLLVFRSLWQSRDQIQFMAALPEPPKTLLRNA